MKTVNIKIQGISPLLINRFKEQDEIPAKTTRGKKDYGTPREQAEATAYRDPDKSIWIPSTWVTGCLRTVSSDYKINGSRKSIKSVIGGVAFPVEEKLFFLEKYKLKDIEIDSRPVVVQRARIMRHRARVESWSLSLSLQIDDGIIPLETIHEMLSDAGRRCGIGDFRPQKGGPFGRFLVKSWKVTK